MVFGWYDRLVDLIGVNIQTLTVERGRERANEEEIRREFVRKAEYLV